MTNYYEILGLGPEAGQAEIKAAFRRLAKIYHPDKNPDGKELFEKIMRAYETLSDPILKSSYDYKLHYHLTHTQREYVSAKNKANKQWRFDEKEMKRRQYYNDHIKKYAKETVSVELEKKTNYNEYKYILFATPLAVALFLLIMKLANNNSLDSARSNTSFEAPEVKAVTSNAQAQENPFETYFGGQQFYKNGIGLSLRNNTGRDVIVCLFTQSGFVRSVFIPDRQFAVAMELPQKLTLRYSGGLNYDRSKKTGSGKATGGFTDHQVFYQSKQVTFSEPLNEVVLLPGINANFMQINEHEFFKRDEL